MALSISKRPRYGKSRKDSTQGWTIGKVRGRAGELPKKREIRRINERSVNGKERQKSIGRENLSKHIQKGFIEVLRARVYAHSWGKTEGSARCTGMG